MTLQSHSSTVGASAEGSAAAVLEVNGLAVSYPGADAPVIRGLNLRVAQGEFVCVVGPSGCGKTTLLKTVTGLGAPDAGTIQVCGRDVRGPAPEIGVVFQEYGRSLLPWLSVRRNVELPLTYQGLTRETARSRGEEALRAVGLWDARDKHPWQLSGGMQQRVAIARALAYRPELLVMDEPFASVDAQTRTDLEDLVLSLWERRGMTVMLVTHDIDEAIYLSDRVVVLDSGPSHVIAEFTPGLARPRDQVRTKADPRFAGARRRIFELLRHRP